VRYKLNLEWEPEDIEDCDDYLLCYLGVEDINGEVLFKHDFLPYSSREIFDKTTTTVSVEFDSETDPNKWVIWPLSHSKSWLKKRLFPVLNSIEFENSKELLKTVEELEPVFQDDVAIITCFFNPCKYNNILSNYYLFTQEIKKYADLHTVELSYDDHWEIFGGNVERVEGTEDNLMWQKERLLNMLAQKILQDPKYKYVAWVDADILFSNPNWVIEMKEKLQENQIVQLFDKVSYMDFRGAIIDNYVSGIKYVKDRKIKDAVNLTFCKPGFAWAARREFFDQVGLCEFHILGGGDTFMFHAFVEDQNPWMISLLNTDDDYVEQMYFAYMERIKNLSHPTCDYVSGEIFHMNHGSTRNRKYVDRTKILKEHHYDYRNDVTIDSNGLLTWTTAKPEFRKSVRDYFYERKEDENINQYGKIIRQLS
tara:strand:- start:5148 stop:6419 length:1272 start_codon:yes stop_codon:yes gene_type:complete